MFENIEKVTRTIIQPTRNSRLRLHVKLLQEKEGRVENFHSLYRKETGEGYLTVDIQSFMTFELVDRDGWDMSKSIMITQRNIYQIIRGFDKLLKAFYEGEMFGVRENGDIFSYTDKVKENTLELFHLGANHRMIVRPAVIYDINEVTYEGVAIHLNRTENVIEMSITEFESLFYALKQANLFVYSQLMLNFFTSTLQEEKIELKEVKKEKKPTTTKTNKQHPMLHSGPKEKVTQSGFNNQTDEDYFQVKFD